MTVIQVDKITIEKMQHFYKDNFKDKFPPHSIFSALSNGVTITVYHSGKALFQGNNANQEAKIWQAVSTTPPKKPKKTNSLPQNFSEWSVIGSDEVGNGSYFGPLVVVSAFVPKEKISELMSLGVKDSKTLTDDKIKQLANVIKSKIQHVILTVTPEKYNVTQPKMSQGQMKAELHNHALLKLLKVVNKNEVNGILIDQFELPKTYWNHLAHKEKVVKNDVYFITKAENEHIAVAAASIIARSEFLNELDKSSKQIGISLPSGAGANVDQIAAKIINEHGLDTLKCVAKWHFANTQKAINLKKRL